jgi:hypothetical protein
MNIEIKNRFNGKIIICGEYESIKNCLETNQGADLRSADLQDADLQGAYLQGAYLQDADLQGAYLRGADLQDAYLRGADLRGADLRGADLRSAYLRSAYLRGADLQGAYLQGADLQGAYLRGADLQGADLRGADLDIDDLLRNNSVQTILTIINWGKLSNELTLEMMRHDAESCGIKAMSDWTVTSVCPFTNSKRDYIFQEDKALWVEGPPQLRGIELLKALCKDKGYKILGEK